MFLTRLINKGKDTVIRAGAGWAWSKFKLNKLGTMSTFRIDTEKHEIFVVMDLQGEPSPIELTVNYAVLTPTRIEIKEVRSSREWIATLVNELLTPEQKQLEVPSKAMLLLTKLIR